MMPQSAGAARGTLAVCDAIKHLSALRDATPHPDLDESLKYLSRAALMLPPGCWAALLNDANVAFMELERRMVGR
jgi:hypothetical protein